MSNDGPLVSVLIPVYNAGEYLKPSIESILHQSYGNLEVIVIDDGSTDGCLSSISNLKDERLCILKQANLGKPAALNRALESAKGAFYAIQDADDLSHENRIRRQLDCFLQNPHLAGVFTGYDLIIKSYRVAPRFCAKDVETCCADISMMRMPSHDPTVMYRFEFVRDVRFDEELPGCEGFDHILRIGERFPLTVLGECLYSYRINPDSVTRNRSSRVFETIQKVYDRAAERRGLKGGWRRSKPYRIKNQREHGLVSHFMESVIDLRRDKRTSDAVKTALVCAKLHPFTPAYYKPTIYTFMPFTWIRFYRGIKSKLLNR